MSEKPATADLAFLTADLPGIAGAIKQRADDFVVHERPLREPSDRGDYLWLYVERRNQMTTDAARRIAKMFGVTPAAVSYAGLKDKHAVSRQHFSVRFPDAERQGRLLQRFGFTTMKLLWARRHHAPLIRGQLVGNDFIIRIRDTVPGALTRLQPVLQRILAHGLPNYVGHQRFGYRQNNHVLGALLVRGRCEDFLQEMLGGTRPADPPPLALARQHYREGRFALALAHWPRSLRHDRQAIDALRQNRSPRQAAFGLDAHHRRFLISALQSAIFNDVLDRRLRANLFTHLLPGDLILDHASGDLSLHAAEAAADTLAPYLQQLQCSPTGPMFGPAMPQPTGEIAQWEQEALTKFGLEPRHVESFPSAAAPDGVSGGPTDPVEGTRRPLRVPVQNLTSASGSDDRGPYVELAFFLPRGSFATALLREVMKIESC